MRSALRVAAGAGALAAALLTAPAPSYAEGVFVEVNPSTIQAGFQVAIRAGCDDRINPATVTSDAFGTVTLNPDHDFLTAAAEIPSRQKARGYNVRLKCKNGQTATTTLWVIGIPTHHERGPDTGGGGMAGSSGTAGRSGPTAIGAGLAVIGAGVGVALLARRRRSPA